MLARVFCAKGRAKFWNETLRTLVIVLLYNNNIYLNLEEDNFFLWLLLFPQHKTFVPCSHAQNAHALVK